jgi:multiple sugar transport system substrate-binding protein
MTRISRREFLRLAALASGATALAACGAPAPATSPAPAQAPAGTPAAGATGYQGTIDFWDWDHEPRVDLMEEIVSEFNARHQGVTLRYSPMDWTDIETRLLAAATAGTGPAFANVHFFWRPELQRAGALEPFPEGMFDWDRMISTPFARDPDTGQIYTATFNWYATQLFYNRELLEAEGISGEGIPRNWDDLMRMAQQLTRRDAGGRLTQAGFSLNTFWAREYIWTDLIYQQGGWMWSEDGMEALWNSDEGVQALQFVKDIYHTWQVDDVEFLGQEDAFGNGQAAMFANQGWAAGSLLASFPQMQDVLATTVEPTLNGTPLPSWGSQFPEEGLAVFSPFPEEVKALAFDFIGMALGSDERRLQWAQIMEGPPDDIELLDAPEMQENEVIDAVADTLPYRIYYGERPLEAEPLWRAMFDQVLLEDADPRAVLDDVTAQMNTALRDGRRRIFTERAYQPPAS